MARHDTGTGLQGMSDRLAAVGGTLEIVSAAGKGTTVYGRVPLAAPAASQAAESRAEPNSAFIR
jgi:signal transduction histidine kinase